MRDYDLAEALRAHVRDEPPLGLTSTDVLTAGRRSRRLRRTGYALGGVAAVSGALLVAVTVPGLLPALGTNHDVAQPVASAPDEATCERLVGGLVDATEASDRLSCYLLDTIPRILPQATLTDNPARPGTAALVAAPDIMGSNGGISATAVVTDNAGTGIILVTVAPGPAPDPDQIAGRCGGATAKATCRIGPHSEHIETFDLGKDQRGVHSRTVYVYVGNTFIVASAMNVSETEPPTPTRPEPPLTIDQLIAIATSPQLVLYPPSPTATP